MSGGNGKHQPGDETRLSKVLIPTELAAFGSLSIQDQIVSVPSRPVGLPDEARKEQVMIQEVINRRFGWALALAAAAVASLAMAGIAHGDHDAGPHHREPAPQDGAGSERSADMGATRTDGMIGGLRELERGERVYRRD